MHRCRARMRTAWPSYCHNPMLCIEKVQHEGDQVEVVLQ